MTLKLLEHSKLLYPVCTGCHKNRKSMHTHLNHPSRRLSYSSSGIDACVCLPLCVCVCVRLTPQLAFYQHCHASYIHLFKKQTIVSNWNTRHSQRNVVNWLQILIHANSFFSCTTTTTTITTKTTTRENTQFWVDDDESLSTGAATTTTTWVTRLRLVEVLSVATCGDVRVWNWKYFCWTGSEYWCLVSFAQVGDEFYMIHFNFGAASNTYSHTHKHASVKI